MQPSHLACPHCGSTLNFGVEIAAGSPVDCLICMGRFVAQSSYVPTLAAVPVPQTATTSAPKTKPTPSSSACVSDANLKETITDKTIPDLPRPVPIARPAKSRPAPQRPREQTGAKRGWLVLVAMLAGLMILLIGGVGVTVWKITRAVTDEPVIAASTTPTKPVEPNDASVGVANVPPAPKPGDTPPTIKPNAPLAGNAEDEEEQRRLMEAAKKSLLRKNPPKRNADTDELGPIAALNVVRALPFGLDQQKINLAIDKGLVYLKTNQNPNGTWSSGHAVGHASIGGLTLLECGVPPNDLFVQRSAVHVRANVANLTATYELSLAILFLDRLGDPRDRLLIQGMALRLLAGQLDGGGWTYHCTRLDPQEMYQLYSFLHANRRPNFFDPIGGNPNLQKGVGSNPAWFSNPVGAKPGDLNDPFQQLDALMLQKAIVGPPGQASTTNPKGATTANPKMTADERKKFEALAATKPAKGKANPVRPEWLKKNLQGLPVVQNQGVGKGQFKNAHGGGDNSNTQFAILALWAARRHDVPTEQAILAAYHRFAHSQNTDGGWAYHVRGASTPSMTCVGLLGEAMGHGTLPEFIVDPNNPKNVTIKPALQDPKIQAGLKRLSQNIGEPALTDKSLPMENLYFLWSVERVAMLYDLKTINGKDWYGWGAQGLVRNQQTNGSWINSHYHGNSPPLNTCFALLFLKRSNLVRDLTDNLRLQSAIRE